jgi:hypothetical protein
MKKLPPLTDQFIRAGIVSGWLIPPHDGPGYSRRRMLLDGVIWTMIGLTVLGLTLYVLFR